MTDWTRGWEDVRPRSTAIRALARASIQRGARVQGRNIRISGYAKKRDPFTHVLYHMIDGNSSITHVSIPPL